MVPNTHFPQEVTGLELPFGDASAKLAGKEVILQLPAESLAIVSAK
jgi:hypothetical protein